MGLNSNVESHGDGYAEMDVGNFATYVAETPVVQLVDVRTPSEYSEGHIPDAVNIDWYDRNFLAEATAKLDKSRPVAVYCRSGKRSAAAAAELEALGFKVANLEGGIISWENGHEPIVR